MPIKHDPATGQFAAGGTVTVNAPGRSSHGQTGTISHAQGTARGTQYVVKTKSESGKEELHSHSPEELTPPKEGEPRTHVAHHDPAKEQQFPKGSKVTVNAPGRSSHGQTGTISHAQGTARGTQHVVKTVGPRGKESFHSHSPEELIRADAATVGVDAMPGRPFGTEDPLDCATDNGIPPMRDAIPPAPTGDVNGGITGGAIPQQWGQPGSTEWAAHDGLPARDALPAQVTLSDMAIEGAAWGWGRDWTARPLGPDQK